MKVISNSTGTKKVRITSTFYPRYMATYIQVYNNEEQVLESKSFSSEKKAIKWANSKLDVSK